MAKKRSKKPGLTPKRDIRITCEGAALVPLESLVHFQGQFKTLSKREFEKLRGTIETDGFSFPVFAWKNKGKNHIIDGHQRVQALGVMLKDGYSLPGGKLPVAWIEAKTEKEAKRKVLLAASQYGRYDEDSTYQFIEESGLEFAELKNILDLPQLSMGKLEAGWFQDSLGEHDEIPDPPKMPITKYGDSIRLGRHVLHCGDSTKIKHSDEVDVVFTSPPYAVGIDYGEYKDTIDNLRNLLAMSAEVWLRAVKPGGFAVVNFGDVVAAQLITGSDSPCEYPMALEHWTVFRNAGWDLWSRRIWCKPTARVHSPWCIQSNRAAKDWEHIWTWKKKGRPCVSRVDGSLGSVSGWCDSSSMDGVDIGKEIHGAGMALGIACWMLNVHTPKQGLVFEPFAGTGTTVIAAEHLELRCVAAEKSPAYCDVIIERWENYTGKKAKRVRA